MQHSITSPPEMQKTEQRECLHCGLPIIDRSDEFCCGGCEAIYATIHSLGLAEFYQWKRCALRDQPTSPLVDVQSAELAVFDSDSTSALVTRHSDGSASFTFDITGIHCAGCVWLLQNLSRAHGGILKSALNATSGQLRIDYKPSEIKLSEAAELLTSLGYPPLPPSRSGVESAPLARADLIRLGVAGFAAMNTMMFAVSLFQGFFSGIDPYVATYLRWWSLAITIPTVTWCAWPLYRNAYSALRLRSLHIELPLSLAILAAFILSTYNTVINHPYVYFDSVCALIFFLLLGRILQERALATARRAARYGWSVIPTFVERIEGPKIRSIPIEQLSAGDTIRIKAGTRIPANGTVLEGTSAIDLSVLTGESTPHVVNTGVQISAGALNTERDLVVLVTAVGRLTKVGLLLEEVSRRGEEKGTVLQLTEKISRGYVYGVLIAALLTGLFWSQEGIARGCENALTLLIVTCPCALAFAAPSIIGITIGEAARRGILIKSPRIVESLPLVRHLFFDKTGTLTHGVLSIHSVVLAEGVSRDYVREPLEYLTAVEGSHPVSRAIRGHLNLTPRYLDTATTVPGRGVSVQYNGHTWNLGSLRWMAELGCTVPGTMRPELQAAADRGYSCTLLARDETIICVFCAADTLRAEAAELVTALNQRSNDVTILSGDTPSSVAIVGTALGLPASSCHGALTPQEKATYLRRASGYTAFIGDGVNDALALDAADVGIAFHGGLEPTLDAADVVMTNNSLRGVQELFDAAGRARMLIRLSLLTSLVYNLAAGTAAACGVMNPLIAAVLMPSSSLILVAAVMMFRPLRGAEG